MCEQCHTAFSRRYLGGSYESSPPHQCVTERFEKNLALIMGMSEPTTATCECGQSTYTNTSPVEMRPMCPFCRNVVVVPAVQREARDG